MLVAINIYAYNSPKQNTPNATFRETKGIQDFNCSTKYKITIKYLTSDPARYENQNPKKSQLLKNRSFPILAKNNIRSI